MLTPPEKVLFALTVVVPVPAWVRAPVPEMIGLIVDHCQTAGIDTVIWQSYWKDSPPPELPAEWLLACNGHASNPWFLDCQRTLLELSDEMVTFTPGSHLGYALALGKSILMARVDVEQDLSSASSIWRHSFSHEWEKREQIMHELGVKPASNHLHRLDQATARDCLNPYFGFDQQKPADALAKALRGHT
jgi:hypothetical protein